MTYRNIIFASCSALILASCATPQENPNYQYSTKYKGASPHQSASVPISYRGEGYRAPLAPAVATYQTASHNTQTISQAASYNPEYQACLSRETNRQLIGGAVGGSAGAFIGKEVIGGTAGTLIGAGTGGIAGYGVGNLSTNCEQYLTSAVAQNSAAVQTYSPAQSVTNASYQSDSLPSYQIAGTTTAPYIEESVITQPAHQSAHIAVAQTHAPAPSPTDAAFGVTTGTPGYEAVNASFNTTPAPISRTASATHSSTITQPPSGRAIVTDLQPITRSVSSRTISAGFNPAGTAHIIEEGDTVYSLSRSVCATIEDVQSLNGLGTNFNIRIGDALRLPASRC